MRRSILAPLAAIAALATFTPACRHAEPPPADFEQAVAPAAAQPLPLEVVVASSLNVRSGPGAEHPIVGRLARGEQVRVLDEESGWKRIRPDAGGLEGWVAGGYLRSPPTP